MRLSFLSLRQIFCLGAITSAFIYSAQVTAAEKVVLEYGVFRGSVRVNELTAFAETGEVSPPLRFYLKAGRANPQEVRQALNAPISVSPIVLDRVLNSPVGGILLDQVSQAVHTPAAGADRQALRSALVLSAARDGKITLIETIQRYPTSEVHVEGDRLVRAYRQLSALESRIQDLLGINLF